MANRRHRKKTKYDQAQFNVIYAVIDLCKKHEPRLLVPLKEAVAKTVKILLRETESRSLYGTEKELSNLIEMCLRVKDETSPG